MSINKKCPKCGATLTESPVSVTNNDHSKVLLKTDEVIRICPECSYVEIDQTAVERMSERLTVN